MTRTRDDEESALNVVLSRFLALEAELADSGLGRSPTETPRAWIHRIRREGGAIVSQARMTTAQDLVEELYRNRYGAL